MGSIRLFGRGKGAVAADAGGAGLSAARIAQVLEGLTAASMSTTWRCRHSAGVSIGEGAVDFATRRSRATVIRGKYTFEYVRDGANVLRAPVTDTDVVAAPAVAADSEPDEDEDLDAQDSEFEDSDGDEDEAGEDAEHEEDAEADAEAEPDSDTDGADSDDDAGDEGGEAGSSTGESVGAVGTVAWERFSDHDACGVHAYAEPSVLAAGVRAAGVVQPREAQEFDGVLLSAYAVTLKPKPGDPNLVLARLARQLRDHGANTLVVTAFVDESASETDGADDDAGEAEPRIVRVRVELPHWTPADDPTADHTVSVDLFEFDEAVSIELPGAAGATRRTARSCADLALF